MAMRDPPIDYSTLPKRVQRVLDGAGMPAARCGQCRQPATLRCTRCKVVKYCSAACQKQHFVFHKRGCKSIEKQRDNIEQELQQKEWTHMSDNNNMEEFNKGLSYLLTMKKMCNLADSLVEIGYRESDTIASGCVYYQEALKYYIEPRRYIQEKFHEYLFRFDDRILLVLVILGGDNRVIEEWCQESGSDRIINYLRASEEEAIAHGLLIEGYAIPDISFQAISLLALMKLLAAYRKNQNGLEVYKETMQHAAIDLGYSVSMEDIFEHISPYLMGESRDGTTELESLPDRIRTVISAIRFHGNGSCLTHLRDTIPFTRDHAPGLFQGKEDAAAPSEFWMMYQDAFFETPGLNDILHEFCPEDLEEDGENA